MKIAYLINQYPRVSHTFIRREIRALEALGLEVHRYSIRGLEGALPDPDDREEAARTRMILERGAQGLLRAMARCSVTRPTAFARAAKLAARVGYDSDRGLAKHGAYLGEACVLVDWLEEANVEHVHAHFGTNSTTVAMLVRALGGPPYSFTVHGPEEFDKPQQIHLKEKIENAAFVAAISSFGRSQLYRWVDSTQWHKVHVVRCGVDMSYLMDHGRPLPDAPRLVCVGRLCEQKGQVLLIEALAEVKRRGYEFELVLVGDGEMRPEIEAAIDRHGMRGQTRITGWASGETVREEILSARALVLPSFAEGLPVVIMEAFGLGRPVISTYVAGIPELVEPGRSGWLVPAGSIDALVGAVCEVLDASPAELARMGSEGQRSARDRHDVRVTATRLYEILVAGRSGVPAAPVP